MGYFFKALLCLITVRHVGNNCLKSLHKTVHGQIATTKKARRPRVKSMYKLNTFVLLPWLCNREDTWIAADFEQHQLHQCYIKKLWAYYLWQGHCCNGCHYLECWACSRIEKIHSFMIQAKMSRFVHGKSFCYEFVIH